MESVSLAIRIHIYSVVREIHNNLNISTVNLLHNITYVQHNIITNMEILVFLFSRKVSNNSMNNSTNNSTTKDVNVTKKNCVQNFLRNHRFVLHLNIWQDKKLSSIEVATERKRQCKEATSSTTKNGRRKAM